MEDLSAASTPTPGSATHVLKLLSRQVDRKGQPTQFESLLFRDMYDISEQKGKLTAHVLTSPKLTNYQGNMHGGCIGALMDTIGTAALCTLVSSAHVSLSITTNYMSPPLPGSALRVVGEVTKMGRSIAHMLVSVYDKDRNTLLAQGTHIKFIQRDSKITNSEEVRQKLSETAAIQPKI